MGRIGFLAHRYGLDLLIVLAAIVGAVEVAFRDDALRAPRTPLWFAVAAVALLALPLLGRRQFPFAAPAAVWLL